MLVVASDIARLVVCPCSQALCYANQLLWDLYWSSHLTIGKKINMPFSNNGELLLWKDTYFSGILSSLKLLIVHRLCLCGAAADGSNWRWPSSWLFSGPCSPTGTRAWQTERRGRTTPLAKGSESQWIELSLTWTSVCWCTKNHRYTHNRQS